MFISSKQTGTYVSMHFNVNLQYNSIHYADTCRGNVSTKPKVLLLCSSHEIFQKNGSSSRETALDDNTFPSKNQTQGENSVSMMGFVLIDLKNHSKLIEQSQQEKNKICGA